MDTAADDDFIYGAFHLGYDYSSMLKLMIGEKKVSCSERRVNSKVLLCSTNNQNLNEQIFCIFSLSHQTVTWLLKTGTEY